MWLNHRNQYALVIPKELTLQILKACHESPTAGHFGIVKTYSRISSKFYWPEMIKDVTLHVQSCTRCQIGKVSRKAKPGLQQPIPIANEVFQTMSMDLVGPLPTDSKTGQKHVITIIDQLSKFVIAESICEANDRVIMEVLIRKVFLVYGPPKIMITDRGTNLCSEYSEKTFKSWGVNHIKTTSYHPQSNGQVENFNKVLGIGLAIFSKSNSQLSEWIQYITYAYNTSKHASTRYTPYYLVYGKDPVLLLEAEIGYENFQDLETENFRFHRLSYARRVAKYLIQQVQQRNKEIVDKKRRILNFKEGDLVLLSVKHHKYKRAGKFINRYRGPYVVLKQTSPVNYIIMTRKGPIKIDTVHIDRLKKFIERKPLIAVRTKYIVQPKRTKRVYKKRVPRSIPEVRHSSRQRIIPKRYGEC